MTERLYYRDPGLLDFTASIVEQIASEGKFRTRLDRSAFYPTSGGQLFDLGLLNGIPVIEVLESEDGEVWHVSDQPIGIAGETISGAVDRARRSKNRQQHTAQHILSAMFIKLYGFETVSVHLGEEYGAIELSTPNLEPNQLVRVERESNAILQENIPVQIIFASRDEVSRLPLRKAPDRTGEIRVIQIGELDCSACGGTHCSFTAEVGLIKLTGLEKIRNRVQVKFLAGAQALQDYSVRFEVTDTLSRSLTCAVSDLPGIVATLGNESKAARKEVGALQKELLPIRAATLAASVTPHNGRNLVTFEAGTMDPGISGQLAGLVAENIKGIAVTISDGRFIMAVAAESGLHAGELAKQLGPKCNLRGGGSNKLAQLGGAEASRLNEYKDALLGLIPHA